MGLTLCAQGSEADWDDLWDQFEERRYLSARKWKGGEDPYRLHAFNQRESERMPSDRAVRDTRHHRFCPHRPPSPGTPGTAGGPQLCWGGLGQGHGEVCPARRHTCPSGLLISFSFFLFNSYASKHRDRMRGNDLRLHREDPR